MEPRGFAEAVRQVARGGSALDPEVVAQMLDRRRRGGPLDELSERELDVLAGMAEGRSNLAIATELGISEHALSATSRASSASSISPSAPRATAACWPSSPTSARRRAEARATTRTSRRSTPPTTVHAQRTDFIAAPSVSRSERSSPGPSPLAGARRDPTSGQHPLAAE